MASFNQITLLGNLGKDPDFNFTPKGLAVCKVSLCVNQKKGGKEEATWFNLVFFDKLAETVEKYLSKGSPILVTGRMCCDNYEDKEHNKRQYWYVNCISMQMLGSKRDNEKSDNSKWDDFDPFEDEK